MNDRGISQSQSRVLHKMLRGARLRRGRFGLICPVLVNFSPFYPSSLPIVPALSSAFYNT
ncbi:hypothetical protein BD311DRAFT_747769 [Dichomitus squalens]|uniref:Uncharacterized protein n=1 Tax=Dichomitus squalens TaxID=114155 RepID=A0A4Q9N0R2_9APHY|nr:hypothetical protein BD311DRAFT_747769 [Dichomitus squalens]